MSEHIVGVEPKEYNGRKYRSTLEARTAETLDKLGISWEYETKKITLQEGFKCSYQKDKVRSIEYIPDFIIGPTMLETKGFETPDWKIKKKLLYKYLTDNEPEALFYIIKNDKQLIQALDKHWTILGYAIQVTSKGNKKNPSETKLFNSIVEAMDSLGLKGKNIGPILRSLTGTREWIYNYKWALIKIKL